MVLKKLGYGPRLSGPGTICGHSNLVRLCTEEGWDRKILECLTCKAQFLISGEPAPIKEGPIFKGISPLSKDTVARKGRQNTRNI